MKKRFLSVILTLCLCISPQSAVYAAQGTPLPEEVRTISGDVVPTPKEVYDAMIALKEQDGYRDGTTWTNDTPYSSSSGYYHWQGGTLGGTNISAVGCVAFACILSDAAFGNLPARMYAKGNFSFEDIKVGDILRVNNDAHTVIVLEVSENGVIVAEGNLSGEVHWGRGLSKDEVMDNASHYITRYPEGYDAPDDPEADKTIADGTLDGGLAWNLTQAGTLTVSGSGSMPDFSSTNDQPWNDHGSAIRKVVIEDGVSSIGACAFLSCGVLSTEIPDSVKTIGNSAFRDSSLLSVTIPSGVKTIGDSAFYKCANLKSVNVSEGVETIGQNAFQACTSLTSISLPASIEEVGTAAFWQCTEMTSADFVPGSRQVTMGDNMFMQCYKLMRVTLPAKMDRIGDGMFQNCLMLAGVEIPQGTKSIGSQAFASCSGFTTVVIPDSVTSIGTAAFSTCPLKDIYFTGSEEQWRSINKMGDTTSAVSAATIHYNYTPATNPDDGDDSNDNNNNNDSDDDHNSTEHPDDSSTNQGRPGDSSSDQSNTNDNNPGQNRPHNSSSDDNNEDSEERIEKIETWKPTTPEEIRRYSCVGKEPVRYTPSYSNVYSIDVENALQGPMCFHSFEAVLGDYTIGRTYNIYALSKTTYSTEQEIQLTLEIPSGIYQKDREYKMICVTKGGHPFLYDDLDSSPETITIETNRFHAYALIYKDL